MGIIGVFRCGWNGVFLDGEEWMQKKLFSGYQLRYAAGLYWLLDMEQEGYPYHPPVPLNETGAELFRMFADGKTEEEAVFFFCREYDVSREEAREDIQQFLSQLARQGVRI